MADLPKRERQMMIRLARTGALSSGSVKLQWPETWCKLSEAEAVRWVDSEGPANPLWREARETVRYLLRPVGGDS